MELKEIGALIYLCEGTKPFKRTDANTMMKHVELVNTDPRIIITFLRYLRSLGIDEKRLKGRLYVHDEEKYDEHVNYWSSLTNIPTFQFEKIVKKISPQTRKKKVPHGVFAIRYYDKPTFEKIEKDIENILKSF